MSVARHEVTGLAGSFEREVCAPHALGRFEDMLLASAQHPAMLLYLDNVQSVGPNSREGQRSGRGLNENLAREIMELHTLGVDGGYLQADVEALARLLTGWGLEPHQGGFAFAPGRHEPGEVTLLGYGYPSGGELDGVAALKDIARHPSTALYVARRVATHFLADRPPEQSVKRLAAVFTETKGDLASVARELVSLPEALSLRTTKLKTPHELVVSMARGIGGQFNPAHMEKAIRSMGQPAFSAPSPQGWSDQEADWLGPDAVMGRLKWASMVGDLLYRRVGDVSAAAEHMLGPRFDSRLRQVLRQASTESQRLALLLASPAFQRR